VRAACDNQPITRARFDPFAPSVRARLARFDQVARADNVAHHLAELRDLVASNTGALDEELPPRKPRVYVARDGVL
jgi:hypothetical protein